MDKKITEGNKLIAEFMGAVYNENWTSNVYKSPVKNFAFDVPPTEYATYNWSPEGLNYHTSWDWLMPSWGKLSSLLLEKGLFDVIEEFKNAVIKNDITAAWGAVVKGVNLLNE